jgi:arylsulfatase
MPTLGELTGSVHPPDVTGRSIPPTLLGEEGRQVPRDELFFEFTTGAAWTRAVRKGDWKLQRFVNKTTGAITRERYHLANDRAESSNLAASNPAKLADLERVMDGSRDLSEFFPRPNDEFPVLSGVAVGYGAFDVRGRGSGVRSSGKR